MANSPTGWVSFNDMLGLTGEQEKRFHDDALQRAQAQDADAQRALRISGNEAWANARNGTGSGDVTQMASYSDYLRAKESAAAAYQKVGANSYGSSQNAAVRSRLGLDQQSRNAEVANAGAGFDRGQAQLQQQYQAAAGQSGQARAGAMSAFDAQKQQEAANLADQRANYDQTREYSEALKAYRAGGGDASGGLDPGKAFAQAAGMALTGGLVAPVQLGAFNTTLTKNDPYGDDAYAQYGIQKGHAYDNNLNDLGTTADAQRNYKGSSLGGDAWSMKTDQGALDWARQRSRINAQQRLIKAAAAKGYDYNALLKKYGQG